MRSQLIAVAALAALAVVRPAAAHHSFAAEFDGNKPVRLVGTIRRIDWSNPHSHFYLDVPDSSGAVHEWACETGNLAALSRLGWKRGDIRLGDKLTVDGYLAKDGSRFIDAQRLILADGRRLEGPAGQ